MTGHFTSYENRTDHELATSIERTVARRADDRLHSCLKQRPGWNVISLRIRVVP